MASYTLTCKSCSDEALLCCDGSAGTLVFEGLLIEESGGAKYYFHRPFEYSVNGNFFTIRDGKGNRLTLDWNDTIFSSAAQLKAFLNNCKCGGGCTRVAIEITDDDLSVPGSPTSADVKTFVDANQYTNKLIYYVGGGSDPAPTGTKVTPDYAWDVDCDGDVVQVESPSAGGSGGGCAYRYQASGLNCIVKATGVGVTAALASGVFTITIPVGVKLCSFYLYGVGGDLAPDNSLTIRIDDSANGGMNTSENFMLPWTIQKWNEASRAASGLSTAPFTMDADSDPQVQLTAVSGSILDHKVINLNGLPFWGLKGVE